MAQSIDAAFIQSQEHRPKLRDTEPEQIPLIDLSELSDQTVERIENACENWGFFQVTNHGVRVHVRDSFFGASREFFRLPLEEKNKVKRDEKTAVGYYDKENTKNVRDWKEVFDVFVADPVVVPYSHLTHDEGVTLWYNHWPQNPPQLREVCKEYAKEMEKLAFTSLGLIAKSLGLKVDRFNGYFKDQTTRIRLNHYPPCPAPELALGVGRHKDGGALTILAQDDVGGLQVRRKSDGEWITVNAIPNSYIINVGDIVQVWSNDKYESVEHRVKLNGEKERFSIPYFFNPSHYTMVEPLEELVDEHNPRKYRAYSWGKFMLNRRRSNFMKLDVENLQIYHFGI